MANTALRRSLGIPDDAERVLIFSESSHWDPDWLFTAQEYFDRFVRRNLDQAIVALQQEPRRIYSIECIFFLRMYWDRFPEQRDKIRTLVNEGRMRLTSSGVTTADTLLPSTEAILRDLLIGQEWLRVNGMTQEPQLAYFADSFGCSPTLPSILNAAGFDRTAITRIDGMYFMGCDLELSRRFPRPGSSADKLLNQERSLDFVWRDGNGAEVLCHWNAFTYGQGDMLAYRGLSRVYLARVAFPARSDRHIARRIRRYAARLSPLSRTPYMLCPIGFDFVEPIPDLVNLLDRYNGNHYPSTGVWAVNAGVDDYLSLIEPYRDNLPELLLDPNPYWTGFYTARPGLKKRCRRLVDDLLLVEKLSFLPVNKGADQTIAKELDDAWWSAAVSNHHDFITGTSPDRVAYEEQIPWLEQASAAVGAMIRRLTSGLPKPEEPAARSGMPEWDKQGSMVTVRTAHYTVELDEGFGGAVVGMPGLRASVLSGISNDLICHRDSGGLWRMGFEFHGGIWREVVKAGDLRIPLEVHERDGGIEIISSVELEGESIRRLMWFSNDSPVIRCRVEGRAPKGHSVTVRFATNLSPSVLVMDSPGGVVTRPIQRIYHPTFWPFQHFVHVQDDESGRGIALLGAVPGAVSFQPDGTFELVALRNATREKLFGAIGIPGNPASGHERDRYSFDYAFLVTENGDWRDNDIASAARSIVSSPWGTLADSIVTTDSPDVRVAAIKPASRGEGIIVRLCASVVPESKVVVSTRDLSVARAFLCDTRERDLGLLDVRDGTITVTMRGTIASIRLLPAAHLMNPSQS